MDTFRWNAALIVADLAAAVLAILVVRAIDSNMQLRRERLAGA